MKKHPMSLIAYSESALDPEKEDLRERSFTRWMSRDLRQATVDFCGGRPSERACKCRAAAPGWRGILSRTRSQMGKIVSGGRPGGLRNI